MTIAVKEFDNLTDLVEWVGENWDDIKSIKEFAEQSDMVKVTMRHGEVFVITF